MKSNINVEIKLSCIEKLQQRVNYKIFKILTECHKLTEPEEDYCIEPPFLTISKTRMNTKTKWRLNTNNDARQKKPEKRVLGST